MYTTENWISELNIKTGICGFVSALIALYNNDENIKKELDEAANKEKNYASRVYAEIGAYVVQLIAKANDGSEETQLLYQISEFTRSFGDNFFEYEKITIPEYNFDTIEGFEDSKLLAKKFYMGAQAINALRYLGIAMPPHAVLNYIKSIPKTNKFENAKLTLYKNIDYEFLPKTEGILGVHGGQLDENEMIVIDQLKELKELNSENQKKEIEKLKFLKHWVYYKYSTVYNYGNSYTISELSNNRLKYLLNEEKKLEKEYTIICAITWS